MSCSCSLRAGKCICCSHINAAITNWSVKWSLINFIRRVVLVFSHSVLAILQSKSRDELQCPRCYSWHTRSKHDRYHAILNQLETITKHTARRDATTLRPPVKDKTDESDEILTVLLPSVELPKTPHSLKCVVVAVTTLALISRAELIGAVQTPTSFLYMKHSDASLAPAWEKQGKARARRGEKRGKKRTQPNSA